MTPELKALGAFALLAMAWAAYDDPRWLRWLRRKFRRGLAAPHSSADHGLFDAMKLERHGRTRL